MKRLFSLENQGKKGSVRLRASLLYIYKDIFLSSTGWLKNKLEPPHCQIAKTFVSTYPDALVANAPHAKDTRCVGISIRPDPWRCGAVEIGTRRCPRLQVVGDLRDLTHIKKAMEPIRQNRSRYAPPYSLARW